MKGIQILRCAAAAAFVAFGSEAYAQAPPPSSPVVRADTFVSIGWLNANKSQLQSGNDWYNDSALGSATFGWHWTDHHKTEVDFAASSRAEVISFQEVVVDGIRTGAISRHEFSTRRLAVSEQYQFGRNVWFHPHLAAGLDVTWEDVEREDDPLVIYRGPIGSPQQVRGRVVHPRRTDVRVRPIAAAGFKAYMTQRSFFRTDVRFAVDRRLDEVAFRFGFGMDF